MALSLVAGSAVALACTVACTPLMARLAARAGVVDRPGHLKPHSLPTPYLGGVAVFVGMALGTTAGAGPRSVLLALAAALVLGLVDDVRTLPPLVRLVVEVGIGVLVAVALSVGGWPYVLATVLATVGCLNAVNFVDGIDGLAAGTTALSCGTMALVLDPPWDALAAAVAAASLGFLMFNRPPARIYLGDAGSYVLGTATAVCLVAVARDADPDTPWPSVAGTLLGFAFLPAVELSSTVLRRLASGQSPLTGDRGHLYDRLIGRWRSTLRVLGVLLGAQAAAGTIALLAERAGGTLPGLLVGAGVVTVALLVSATAIRSPHRNGGPA